MNLFITFLFPLLFSTQDYREIYKSQDEDRVKYALKVLSNKSNLTSDESCYKAVFECMNAEYLINPYQKLSSFNRGYSTLNALINRYRNNAEYRYHRYMIEKNAPSWLIDTNHMKNDRSVVRARLNKQHPMYSFIMKTMN